MITFSEEGRAASTADIAALERQVGAILPSSYCRFLRTINGGHPRPDVIDVPGLTGSPTDVRFLFGIARDLESENILWNLPHTQRDFPAHRLIPIGCDSGGNQFCLDAAHDHASKVVFCDQYGWYSSLPTVHDVAPDFDAFLHRLRSFAL